jgi:hypothetical protein
VTFLEALQSHKGGLIRIKTQLYWYSGRGWDGDHDRICLLMDSVLTYDGAYSAPSARTRYAAVDHDGYATAACLLIDGRPHWVWIAHADVELL